VVFSGHLVAVEVWLADRMVNRRPGPAPGPRMQPLPALWAPWLDLFAAEQRGAARRPLTIRNRLCRLAMFARAHPGSDPLTVSRQQLADFLGAQLWAPETKHNVRAVFVVFWGFLHERGHRDDDPSKGLLRVRVPRSKPRPCPDEWIKDALASASDPRARLAIRIAAETGLRRAELAALRTTDVMGCPGRYLLHVGDGKGGRQRQVPISDDLAAVLLSIPTKYVFLGRHGAPLSSDYLGRLIARALPDSFTAHGLRHRFGTTAYGASHDLRAVQELLGHSSPTTTAVYTAVGDHAMRAAAMATLMLPE
jgi:integrase